MSQSPHRALLVRALAGIPADAPLVGARRAAVAVVLLEISHGLEVLLIERAVREGDPWSGHMGLPGGHVAPQDSNLAATAERETREEVGIDLQSHGGAVGQLSDCTPVRGVPIGVRPYVYLLTERPELTLSAEVQAALWVPVAPLVTGARNAAFTLERGGERMSFPAWAVDGRLVWGLTYRVLSELFTRMNRDLRPE